VADLLSGKSIPDSPFGVTRSLPNKKKSPRFHFVGEQGAAALDKAEEASVRMDNLGAAKAMETAKKDAKAIKMATGWERGADGKWRYEIPDVEWNDGWYDLARNGGIKRLSDVVENEDLFKAYPKLHNVAVMLGDIEFAGYYAKGIITLNRGLVGKRNMLGTMIHEIQHAIQEIEGFASGSNTLNSSEKKYFKTAGEVEARNATRRMDITPKERRASLAAETEDVAREDQIFLYDSLGEKRSEEDSSLEGLEIIETPGHDFKNIAEARTWAKENIIGTYHNTNTGEDIGVSKTAIDKYLSEKAVNKSAGVDAHLSALKQLPKLIETSVLRETTPDRDNDNHIKEIQRLYGGIKYKGKKYPVKITVKATYNDGNKAYSYEVMEIETPEKGAGSGVNASEENKNTRLPDVSVNESRGKGTNNSETAKHISETAKSGIENEAKRIAANAVMPRSAKTVSEAQELIKPLVGKPITNKKLGITGTISGKSLGKLGSESATNKSVSPALHAKAVANIDVLFENAEFDVIHKDYKNDRNVENIHRLGSLMFDEASNDFVPVMITVKEFNNNKGNRIYSVEAVDLVEKEKSAGQLTRAQNEGEVPIADFNTKVQQLIETAKQSGENFLETAKTVRFHTEGDTEADAAKVWLDELEKELEDKFGKFPRFHTETDTETETEDKYVEEFEEKAKKVRDVKDEKATIVHASKVRQNYQDDALLVRRMEENVKENGGTVTIENSIYEKRDLVAPRIQAKSDKATLELYNPLLDTVAKMQKKHEVEYIDAGRYLIALHASERNAYIEGKKGVKDGSGMSDADAAQRIQDFESKVPKELIDRFLKQISAIRDFNLDSLLYYGRITEEEYNELKTRYKYYVPLQGWEEKEDDEILEEYINDGRSTGTGAASLMKTAKGRKSMADNPIYNMMHYTLSVISWGEKNRVKQAAWNFASENKNRTDLFAVGYVPKRHVDKFREKQHVVEAWIGGTKKIVAFAQPKIANIINNARGDELHHANWFKTWSRIFTRFRMAVLTSKNPNFIPSNQIRDIRYGGQKILIEDGPVMAGKFARFYKRAFGEVWREVWHGNKKQTIATIRGRDIYGNPKTWRIAELYEEFKSGGAVTGFIQSRKMEDVRKNLNKMLDIAAGERGFHKRIYDAINGFLNDLAEISENTTRFAAYVTYRTSGRTMAETTRKAKEVTVNFNRKGEKSQMIGAFIGFFNSGAQGPHNTLSMWKDHPVKMAISAALKVGRGLGRYELSKWLLAMLADDEDDDERAQNLKWTMRDMTNWKLWTNTYIPVGTKMVTIPMSHSWRMYDALGVMIGQFFDGTLKPSEFVKAGISMTSQSLSPFDLTDGRSFLPIALTPMLDALVFGTDFMDVPLQKDMFTTEQEEKTKNLHKAMPGTSPFFTNIARGAARLAGLDPDNPDRYEELPEGGVKTFPYGTAWLLDINPTHVQHIVRGYLDGVFRTAFDTYEAGRGLFEGITGGDWDDLKENNRIPVWSRFVSEPRHGTYAQNRFWQMKRYLDTWHKTNEANYKEYKDISGNTKESKERNKVLDRLYSDMTDIYYSDIQFHAEIIKEKNEDIVKKKADLKNAVTSFGKRQLKDEIKNLETEIETEKKAQIKIYRKAVDELDPKLSEIVDYTRFGK
jgi:hypothetical protein